MSGIAIYEKRMFSNFKVFSSEAMVGFVPRQIVKLQALKRKQGLCHAAACPVHGRSWGSSPNSNPRSQLPPSNHSNFE